MNFQNCFSFSFFFIFFDDIRKKEVYSLPIQNFFDSIIEPITSHAYRLLHMYYLYINIRTINCKQNMNKPIGMNCLLSAVASWILDMVRGINIMSIVYYTVRIKVLLTININHGV